MAFWIPDSRCIQCAVLNEQLRSPLQIASENPYGRNGSSVTTTQQLAGITAQHNEIVKRVVNGSLDADHVRDALQLIIEKKFPVTGQGVNVAWQAPSWYISPEAQLERARELWPDTILPEIPAEFVPQTGTEVLLLHVPRPFDELWDKAVAPVGYTKFRTGVMKSGRANLRLAPNVIDRTEPVWLAFDPEANKGKRPDSLWGKPNLAAGEVLSALIQFPGWCLSWFNGASAPNLSGYQLKYQKNWSLVPYLDRWDGTRQLRLDAYWADSDGPDWASPSVREC
jgi:hypothetical protein